MTKQTVLRLPDWAGTEVEKKAEERGLAFATMCRVVVVDWLKKQPAEAE